MTGSFKAKVLETLQARDRAITQERQAALDREAAGKKPLGKRERKRRQARRRGFKQERRRLNGRFPGRAYMERLADGRLFLDVPQETSKFTAHLGHAIPKARRQRAGGKGLWLIDLREGEYEQLRGALWSCFGSVVERSIPD